MGHSYIIKYVGQVERGDRVLELYRMRYEDLIGDFAASLDGLKAGEHIKVYRQTTGAFLGAIKLKQDIPKPKQDAGFQYIDMPAGISWRNRWIIPRKYYQVIP